MVPKLFEPRDGFRFFGPPWAKARETKSPIRSLISLFFSQNLGVFSNEKNKV